MAAHPPPNRLELKFPYRSLLRSATPAASIDALTAKPIPTFPAGPSIVRE